jgi:hypothetical protein
MCWFYPVVSSDQQTTDGIIILTEDFMVSMSGNSAAHVPTVCDNRIIHRFLDRPFSQPTGRMQQ